MSKYFITGVAGLLGSNLADYILTNTDHEVYGIDDLSGGYIDNVHPKVVFHNKNILDKEFDEIFATIKPDYVYHFAAYAAEGLSPFIRCFNYDNNLKCTAKVVNNCIRHDVKRLVFTSSMATYGRAEPPFHEDLIPQPIDPYGIAKYACEMDIKVAGEQHNLDWCIIRPHNVYGIKQNIWDKYRNVLGIWMYQHLNGQPITIFGEGKQTRAFSYIEDSVVPLYRASQGDKASKQIINLGGTKECTIDQAANTLLNVIGNGTKKYMQARHEVKHAYSTYKKSEDLLGFSHKTSLHDGLQCMWNWAKQRPKKERFVWPFYELDKGIYSFWK